MWGFYLYSKMGDLGIISLLIVLANAFATYKGLSDGVYFRQYAFVISKILVDRDYKRLITSGFLHVNWIHFSVNMVTLYCFSSGLEAVFGPLFFLVLYFGSLLGGNLLSLYVHRSHTDYSAVGASGAVSGIVFASIALFPGMEIGFLMLPVSIPAWAYGLAYVLYSIYGIQVQKDNVGHEAHLGGGLIGLCIAIASYPDVLFYNYLPVLLILVPSVVFLYLVFTKPSFLLVKQLERESVYRDIDERYYAKKRHKELELNKLLEKIHENGIESLSHHEKERLKDLSE